MVPGGNPPRRVPPRLAFHVPVGKHRPSCLAGSPCAWQPFSPLCQSLPGWEGRWGGTSHHPLLPSPPHCITHCLRLAGTSGAHRVRPLGAGGPGPRPDGFWISPRMEAPPPPWWCSVTLTGKKCLLTSRGTLPRVRVCPWPLVLSLGTTGRAPTGSVLSAPCLQGFMHVGEIPLSPLCSGLSGPSSPSLSS